MSSSSVAANIVGLVQGMTRNLCVDMAIVLEGHTTEELPESLLGTVRCSHLDLNSARLLDIHTGAIPNTQNANAHVQVRLAESRVPHEVIVSSGGKTAGCQGNYCVRALGDRMLLDHAGEIIDKPGKGKVKAPTQQRHCRPLIGRREAVEAA